MVHGGLPCGSTVKESACNAEDKQTPVQSLGWEDPLEEDMTTHSNILAWKIPCTEEPGGLWSMGSKRVENDWSDWAYKQACTHDAWCGKKRKKGRKKTLGCSRPGVFNLQDLTPDGVNGTDAIIIEIKYTINVKHFNHPETTPHTVCEKIVFHESSSWCKKFGDPCRQAVSVS